MASHHPSAGVRPVELDVERWLGAALVAAMGVVHLVLWLQGFSMVPVIGPLFLLNVIGSGLLTIALLVSPRRLLSMIAVLAAVFTLGTLLALVLSLTVGLFGYHEELRGIFVILSLPLEAVGTLVLARLAISSR